MSTMTTNKQELRELADRLDLNDPEYDAAIISVVRGAHPEGVDENVIVDTVEAFARSVAEARFTIAALETIMGGSMNLTPSDSPDGWGLKLSAAGKKKLA